MNKEVSITLCAFNPAKPGPYEQYILPHIAAEMRREPERFTALGAAWRRSAVGAAVLTDDGDDPDTAVLSSLFVDPQARGKGVCTALLTAAAETAAASGAKTLRLSYTLAGEELEAMDRAVRAVGGEPEYRFPVYTMDAAEFHDSRLLGRAFRPDYKPPENVVSFLNLTQEQLETLHADPEATWYAPGMQPELSLAYLQDGRVTGFWLGRMSAPGNYAVQGVWCSSAAPVATFHTLITAHVNLCYYHGGGDFLYHCAASVEFADKLLQRYTEGKFRRLEEHRAVFTLSERMRAGTQERLASDSPS